jgi:hypothetical protein
MHDLRFKREAIEKTLKYMLTDRAPDATPIDPSPSLFRETKYKRLTNLVNGLNRTIYLRYLCATIR